MFHYFTLGVGLFTENIHAWRGPVDDVHDRRFRRVR